MTSSIFWYDYETTGIDPRCDRPLQVAGIRTDEALNPIGEPLNLYCRLSDDILPHPVACQVTGIRPATLAQKGLDEAHFVARLHAELAQPGTCTAGYNSLRFDDEVTRYTLYRNFHDPYGREWQGGNSRWDLIDLVRSTFALRPEGLVWPEEQGRISLRLDLLTRANGIEHTHAHDALSDVRATIALARLIRERQPRLYAYFFRLRHKQRVQEQIQLLQPLLHVSGRFAADRHFLSVALPLAWHPRNRNALVVLDLVHPPESFLERDAETLKRLLYTRRADLAEGELPVPLKLLHINRCPIVAPLSVVREEDRERLGLDLSLYVQRATQVRDAQLHWQDKLEHVYGRDEFVPHGDPEQQLYDGFFGDRDRRLCEQVRQADPLELARGVWPFDDPRLPELLFRYRARNFPQTLSAEEQVRWQAFCRDRLSVAEWGAPNTLADFDQALQAQLKETDAAGTALLLEWRGYADQLRRRHGL
ncbi:exodeoxyribonuclease I [Pseudomonas mangiferae]|uniref:Exodeoxyribonuclease I n=1 Tax=Pseudomonas mangiferae TaxID=2593654 RepID=A0A553H0Z4_9PSED|nr:exodeoxyribonuclease I [Pseudomonas mangiferae]TRX75417.1 exodeoxyribonuclease I [Pseudomonas mangiferae]